MNDHGTGAGSRAALDFRTEVVSRPTEAMWRAMQQAPIGWASRGEDPSVRELERRGADLAGQEAALFVPTTSTANLLGLFELPVLGGRAQPAGSFGTGSETVNPSSTTW